MDLDQLVQRLEGGEELEITYHYPVSSAEKRTVYRTRTDRLLAVEPSNGRFFVSFKGAMPVWIEANEVVTVKPPI